ncbi:MAG TPA: hypothetical protein ENH45_02425, partial [Nitrospirae bacterium]|nr:hypothetical protein [Nitrospirota bacterium]
MDIKLKIYPVLRITTAVILFSCLCLSGQEANAFHQNHPNVITPQPGPRAQTFNDPSVYKLSSQEIIKTFKESGLEVVNIQKGITMGSRAARETTIFLMPSVGENIGGLISSYSSPK